MKNTMEQNFYDRIIKTNTCWIWKGNKNHAGYGIINTPTPPRYIKIMAHRYSYALHFGMHDLRFQVCHKCDNPSCVNPDHLFLGTAKDNVRDMILKGRNPDWHKTLTGTPAKIHCKNGHKYTDETRYYVLNGKNCAPLQRCKICHPFYGKKRPFKSSLNSPERKPKQRIIKSTSCARSRCRKLC